MANIGSLSVQLLLDSALFTSGLDRATKEGKAFASTITKAFSGIGAGVAGLEGIGGAASSVYSGYKSNIDAIVEQGREAQRLGTSLEGMAGINRLLGKDAEGGAHAFQHFSAHLSEAASGAVDAVKPFRQLGLNIKDFDGLPFEKSLGTVIDKIGQLNANDRNFIGKELFGREGPRIVAELAGGSKSIADSVAAIKAHGGLDLDVKGAIEAQRSIAEMERSWQQIALKLSADVAPIAKNIADSFSNAAGAASAMQKALGQHPATAGAGTGLLFMANAASFALTSGALSQAALFQSLPDNGSTGGGASFEADIGASLDKSKDFSKVIDDLNTKLRGQVASFGMSADAAERFKLAYDGATAAELAGVDAGIRELAVMKGLDESVGKGATSVQQMASKFGGLAGALYDGKLSLSGFTAEWGKFSAELGKKLDVDLRTTLDGIRTPLDKFKDGIQNLEALRLMPNGLNDKGLALAFSKEWKELSSSYMATQHAPGALLEGSNAAYSQGVAFQREGSQGNAQDQMKTILEEIREQEKRQLEVAQRQLEFFKQAFVGQSIGQ